MRRFVIAILVFASGIAIAYAVVSAGCVGAAPPLGTMCGHNALGSVVIVTLASWFVLGIAAVGYESLRTKRERADV